MEDEQRAEFLAILKEQKVNIMSQYFVDSDNLLTYTASLPVYGTPDLSNITSGMQLSVSGSGNALNDGDYQITNVNNASNYVDIDNGNRTSSTGDESADATGVGNIINSAYQFDDWDNLGNYQGTIPTLTTTPNRIDILVFRQNNTRGKLIFQASKLNV